jgi:hypothetical protein
MLVAWGDAVANRVQEYDSTNSVTSFIWQIKAAFKGVNINLPTLI